MKLQSKSSDRYPKFVAVGDRVAGKIVSFADDVPGRFGPETLLTIRSSEAGEQIVRCSTTLGQTLRENVGELTVGRGITIELADLKEIGKSSPLKLFDVELDDVVAGDADDSDADETSAGIDVASPSGAVAASEIPF